MHSMTQERNQKVIQEAYMNKFSFPEISSNNIHNRRLILQDIFYTQKKSIYHWGGTLLIYYGGQLNFPPLFSFAFITIYLLFFNLLYIYRETPERAASFDIFTLNIKCGLKGKKFRRRKSDSFFYSNIHTHLLSIAKKEELVFLE